MRDLFDLINPPPQPRGRDFDDFTDPPEDTLDDIDDSEDISWDSIDELIEDIINPPSER